jgi:hypothetical protein
VEAILCVEYDSIKSQNIQINKLEKEGDMWLDWLIDEYVISRLWKWILEFNLIQRN